MKGLKHNADALATQLRQRVLIEAGDLDGVEQNAAGRGTFPILPGPSANWSCLSRRGQSRPTASPRPSSRSISRSILTGPAADGTVRRRFLIRTSGVVALAGSGEGGMGFIGTLYWGFAQRRKGRRLSMSVLAHLIFLLVAVSSTFEHATALMPLRLLVLGICCQQATAWRMPTGSRRNSRRRSRRTATTWRSWTVPARGIPGRAGGPGSTGARRWRRCGLVELGENDGLRGLDPKERRPT